MVGIGDPDGGDVEEALQDVRPFHWTIDSLAPAPAPGVWVVDLDCLADLPVSTEAERMAAEFYGEPLWAHRFLARRAAVRRIAADLAGLPPDQIGLQRTATGALRFDPPLPDLSVSLSHRGPYAAMAFARTPIGVDLESVGDFLQVPWNVLHPREVAALQEQPADQLPLAFLRLWTVKEAYVKALGLGLSREPSSFCVTLREGTAAIDDPLTSDRPPVVATRVIQSLGPADIVVSCVGFPDAA